jgi:hypothetical protein
MCDGTSVANDKIITDLEDDSSQLDEIKELFSDVTLPLKVDKLAKVELLLLVLRVECVGGTDLKVSSGWRQKVLVTSKSGDSGEEKEEGGEGKTGEGNTGEEGGAEGVSKSEKKVTSEVSRRKLCVFVTPIMTIVCRLCMKMVCAVLQR